MIQEGCFDHPSVAPAAAGSKRPHIVIEDGSCCFTRVPSGSCSTTVTTSPIKPPLAPPLPPTRGTSSSLALLGRFAMRTTTVSSRSLRPCCRAHSACVRPSLVHACRSTASIVSSRLTLAVCRRPCVACTTNDTDMVAEGSYGQLVPVVGSCVEYAHARV